MDSLESRLDSDTRPFVLETLPVSLRDDNATIKQDAGRAAVLESRTLLGKLLVDSAVVVAAGGANVGDGTVTVASVIGLDTLGNKVIPKIGAYAFTLTAALVGKITDPSGVDIVTGIALNDGSTTIVQYDGLIFTVTDGATAFEADDTFSITVAEDGDLTPYDPASVLGADKPFGIYDPEGYLGDIAAADIVAGDVTNMPVLRFGVMFDKDLLVFENSGAYTDIIDGITLEEYLSLKTLFAKETQTGSRPENS